MATYETERRTDPLVERVHYAAYNDIDSVQRFVNEKTCAIFIEPVQGEGGVVPAHPQFLKDLRNLCDEKKLLLVFDEVQTGIGRTGKLFCYQHWGVQPDVLVLAKALGGGLPIGACVATNEAAELLGLGDHASTFGGNPVACAAALQVLRTVRDPLLKSSTQKAALLMAGLNRFKEKYSNLVKEVRGIGLMMGLELTKPGGPVVEIARSLGLLINCTQDTVLRILPPLTVSTVEIKAALKILDQALDEYSADR